MSAQAAPDTWDGGFTLLELLVALALTAVIGTIMAVAVTQLRPMRAFEERLDEQQVVTTLSDVIARDLRLAQRLPLVETGGSSGALLRGTQQKITFTAVVPTGYKRQGLREVEYELVPTGNGSKLLRTIKLRRFTQQDAAGAQTDELYFGNLELSFRFLRLDARSDGGWATEFSEINQLPLAVEFEIGMPRSPAKTHRKTINYSND